MSRDNSGPAGRKSRRNECRGHFKLDHYTLLKGGTYTAVTMAEPQALPEGWRTILEACDFKIVAEDLQQMIETEMRAEKARSGPGEHYLEPRFLGALRGFFDAPSLATAIALLEIGQLPALWRIFEDRLPDGQTYFLHRMLDVSDDESDVG